MTQIANYAAVLAKIGSERSKLLDEAKLKSLAETSSLGEFIGQIRDSTYQLQVSKISPPVSSKKLERAFHENLIEVIIKVIESSPQDASEYLLVYLYRFEVENLKTLIKAVNAHLSPEQRLAKIYLSVENYLKNRALIEEVSRAVGMREIVTIMRYSDYALALSMGLQSYEEDGSTACMDVLLDKVYLEKMVEMYNKLPSRDRSHAKFYISITNDSFTLLTLLRSKLLQYDPDWLRLAVPRFNFNLSRETVEAIIAAPDFDLALRIALETSYKQYMVKSALSEETIANSKKAFDKALLQHAKASRISESFNIEAALAFVTQKEAEVHNLTAIASGVEASFSPIEIQSRLLT